MYHPLVPAVRGWRRPLIGFSPAVAVAKPIWSSGGVLTNAAPYLLQSAFCDSSISKSSMKFNQPKLTKFALLVCGRQLET